MKNPLVTTDWLAANLGDENLVVLDASMVKVVGRVPLEYDPPQYIPGSLKLDLEQKFCDLQSEQVHALPAERQFQQGIEELGVRATDQLVIYDNQGIYSSPRAWWMFQCMGIEALVLDGGLPKWIAEGRITSVELASSGTKKSDLAVKFNPDLVCDSSELLRGLGDDDVCVLDARSQARFLGQEEEPRAGVRKGHIPNSRNLPFAEVLEGDCFKQADELAEIFAHLSQDSNNKLVFSCGSGITACIILLASVICGYENQLLYDGSWADWGSNHELPIE